MSVSGQATVAPQVSFAVGEASQPVPYEILDDDQNIMGTLGMEDFEALLAAQAS